jgi:hypothetical protein
VSEHLLLYLSALENYNGHHVNENRAVELIRLYGGAITSEFFDRFKEGTVVGDLLRLTIQERSVK